MDNLKFSHLHVHTEYSLLDGSAKIKELVQRAKDLGMDSLAITDHGSMFGVIDFYKAAKEIGIKPIIGCEVYVAPGSRLVKDSSAGLNYYHLVLLAENNAGYQNLIKIVSLGYTEGFYYKPRVDEEVLRKYSEGIIASSACLAGPVARTILQVSYEKAKEIAIRYEDIFGKGNFYLEMQDHGMSEQKIVNQQLIRMNKETGIPMICTNDSHYIYEEDNKAHDILLCIQTGKTVNDEERMKYEGSQFYLKSPKEMYELFPENIEALENTCKIASRCNVDFTFHELKLPKFDVPESKTSKEYLREICYDGFNKLYDNTSPELKDRLEYELETIEDMGYVDYFLIVWDFIKYAKDNGISVGPGRGSAAGSIVSYCLRITTIDPIKYSLIFERFLNPERISMPDIDIDFCYERRQEVIDYVIEKYGEDHVAQIITFGTLAARAAIKDVGRALAMPYAEVDRISKMIPFELGITIDKALKMNPELQSVYMEEDNTKYLIDMSRRLEGLPRHSSTHAAGVVICERPVMEYVPLNSNDGAITTQYSMTILEELGLLKMDFLGLRTLTVIQSAVKEIKRTHNIDINIDNIDFDDPKVYTLISQGKTDGLFQLESSGMKQFMKELQPSGLEDLIAGISLYRPGPMDFIPKYINGKNNAGNINYTHESLRPILNTTYGCIVYQEQVMQIVRDLAGYSLGRSDLVRRAMSKKKSDVMSKERDNFVYGTEEGDVHGCVKNGIPADVAEKIFDEMTDFAKYAFNKSHAACYAVVGYQTGWLKTYYPVEFLAAIMTSVMDNASKVSAYIEECKKMSIELLPPDINEGFGNFSVSGDKIRYGLSAIKNVGKNTIKAIVEEREKSGKFKSLSDFCNRLDGGELNRRTIESFIKGGAFDSFGGKRSQYLNIYKNILDGIIQAKKNNIEGQLNLFEIDSPDDQKRKLDDILLNMEEIPLKEKLSMEKEVLGIYVTGHPLSEYEVNLRRKISHTSLDFIQGDNDEKPKVSDGEKVVYGGIITDKVVKYTRSNKAMAFIKIEDLYGVVEVIVFPDIYNKYYLDIQEGAIVLVRGRASISQDEESKIISEKISLLNEMEKNQKEYILFIKVNDENELTDILPICKGFKGDTPIRARNTSTGAMLELDRKNWVVADEKLISAIKEKLGEENVVLKEK